MKSGWLKVCICLGLLLLTPYFSFAIDNAYIDPLKQGGEQSGVGAIKENVYPYSGDLTIAHTDIFLPGNSGLDLKIMRVYNSAIWGTRNVFNPGLIAYNKRSPLGIGWSMHMGVVYNPRGAGSANQSFPDNPVVEMADGSKIILYKRDNSSFISKDYALYIKRNDLGTGVWQLTLANGTVYTFRQDSTAGYNTYDGIAVAQATSIKDASGKAVINISYLQYNGYSRIDRITDSVGRNIQFGYTLYNNSYYNEYYLNYITFNGRTYTYTLIDYNTNIGKKKFLTQVSLPTGNPWVYSYYANNSTNLTTQLQLKTLTYPSGGTITYTYNDISFLTGNVIAKPSFNVVATRTTGGRGVTSGLWQYSYVSGGTSGDVTTVTAPDGITETYTYHGWMSECPTQVNGGAGVCGNVWRVGLPKGKVVSGPGGNQTESYTWATDTSKSISNDTVGNPGYSGTTGWVYDSKVYSPRLTQKDIARDGKTYTTQVALANFDNYGNPKVITETSDGRSKTRNISYWYNTTLNIVRNKPSTETDTGYFTGSATTSYIYDNGNPSVGNLTRITKMGVPATIQYNSTTNNISSVTDANDNTTTYQWNNGVVSSISNPMYTVTKVINPDGTIKSETNGRNYTTSYDYDGLLRLTKITPPTGYGNPTTYTYQPDYTYMIQTRGGFSTRFDYDGFGRVVSTNDSIGRNTFNVYLPYGIKDYSTTNTGDTVFYDYFGRNESIVHKDNKNIVYNYSNGNVKITDESQRNMLLTYYGFGNPDEKYLMSVTDASDNVTNYNYNILGRLTSISQGGTNRIYAYNPTTFFLDSETHPEKGTIIYQRYPLGNLKTITDANNGTIGYLYDSMGRLKQLDYKIPTSPLQSISFEYDNANNRTKATTPGGMFDYSYDGANRLTQKQETINGKIYTTNYVPDNNDNLQDIYYPSGRNVHYSYNGINQVTSVTGWGGDITNIQYYTDINQTYIGLPQSYNGSNGITTSFTYTNRNFTSNISGLPGVTNITYGYDDTGNLWTITNNLDRSKDQGFTYDSLNRLETYSGSYGAGSFTYDPLGNRKTKFLAGLGTTYNYLNNRLMSTTGGEVISLGYNGNGEATTYNSTNGNYSLSYNALHNLTAIDMQSGGNVATYTYDGDGQRITKTVGGKTTTYHYDPQGRVLTESDDVGGFTDYIYLHGKLVARVDNPYTPKIVISPTSSLSFGQINVGGVSSVQTLTISNTDRANLVIGTIGLGGTNPGQFRIQNDLCSGYSLPTNATCTVGVSFAPTVDNAASATLTIPSNDPDSPTANVLLIGTGINIDITVVSISGPSSANPGQPFTVTMVVRNQGTTAAGAFRVGIYLSPTPTISTGNIFLGAGSVSSLAGGTDNILTLSAAIPVGTASGTYYLGAIADDTNLILEVNEANNATVGNTITLILPVSGVTLSATPPGPQVAGTAVTFTALATGGTAPFQYRFRVYDNVGTVVSTQAYDTNATCIWNTTGLTAGTYSAEVSARSNGSGLDNEAVQTMSYTVNAAVSAVTLSASPASPQVVGTAVTFTGLATGGTAPFQYRYRIYDNVGTVVSTQAYDNTATFVWSTAGLAAGTYTAEVSTRSNGSGLDNEAVQTMPYTVDAALPLIETYAGNGNVWFSGDNVLATTTAVNPNGIAVDGSGNLYIADYNNHRIRKVDTNRVISTVAGSGDYGFNYGFSGDGGPAVAAKLYLPTSVAVDRFGNIYIADMNNARIRKVDSAGIISTLAGNGTYGFSGDGGPATQASLAQPSGVAVDGSGNVYIADSVNDRIRKVDTDGTITTFAGGGTQYDVEGGPATDAALGHPYSVAVDNAGNVFIADTTNRRVRKVDTSNHITTVAGIRGSSTLFAGDGGPAIQAYFGQIYGVTVDQAGNLYISDWQNNRVRKVTGGIVETVAGNGATGYSGDGGPAIQANIGSPVGIAVNAAGNIFVSQPNYEYLRRIY